MTTDIRTATLETLPDSEAVALRMADLFIEGVLAKTDGLFRVALSGGSTPKRLFEILATPSRAKLVPWERVEIFYGDERHVPEGHADSNHTVGQSVLLSHVPVPAQNVHAIPTGDTVEADAQAYEKTLRTSYGATELDPKRPLFDLVMLGLGTDGHTASLFPGQPVLKERKAWVGTAAPSTAPYERITLTYPAIQSSALVVFLVTGASKVEMLERLVEGDSSIPSARVTSEGRIVILADRAAVGEDA
ncbi:6-phosphogluconolactonase [Gluconobacter sp. LMG 1744]|uniref:6-phosphogluconolactonase n=1 Tax=Gluconobacter TaxID=441 RepID=UPI001884A015|nr:MULTISPECIES: 6-phosphogluconolactonase [Gluconobacter]MBF0890203.1 6-phosphogluconolactonase [Gluconobacter cadivus]MBS1073447.1 6-phosphogluconolactonase [Gluconobacter sp. Dm-73]